MSNPDHIQRTTLKYLSEPRRSARSETTRYMIDNGVFTAVTAEQALEAVRKTYKHYESACPSGARRMNEYFRSEGFSLESKSSTVRVVVDIVVDDPTERIGTTGPFRGGGMNVHAKDAAVANKVVDHLRETWVGSKLGVRHRPLLVESVNWVDYDASPDRPGERRKDVLSGAPRLNPGELG